MQQFFTANFLLWPYTHDFVYKNAYCVIVSDCEFVRMLTGHNRASFFKDYSRERLGGCPLDPLEEHNQSATAASGYLKGTDFENYSARLAASTKFHLGATRSGLP
jgi:hypothetical protein